MKTLIISDADTGSIVTVGELHKQSGNEENFNL